MLPTPPKYSALLQRVEITHQQNIRLVLTFIVTIIITVSAHWAAAIWLLHKELDGSYTCVTG